MEELNLDAFIEFIKLNHDYLVIKCGDMIEDGADECELNFYKGMGAAFHTILNAWEDDEFFAEALEKIRMIIGVTGMLEELEEEE